MRGLAFAQFFRQRSAELAVGALLTALCLALPTRNPTGDAWYYAACSRWGHELWQPHHLLYNGVGWWWLQLVGATGPAPAGLAALPWLQALNTLAYGGCLLALGPLLRQAGARPAAVPAWLLVVGSSFAMLRFAVENEAYIQPLLLALLASWAWARALATHSPAGRPPASPGYWLLAGSLAALACLVHQVMVWWWVGLLLGLQPWRGRAAWQAGWLYAAPALVVPLAYGWAAPGADLPGVLRFALHDYLTGAARVELGWRTWLLTPISLVRTLLQLHGNLLPLLRRWPLPLGAVALGCLLVAGWAVLGPGRARWPKPTEQPAAPAGEAEATPPAGARQVRRTHLLIGGLQFVFAALAAGNAEFMVMLPALAAIALAGGALRSWPSWRLAALGTALLGWNLAFGLLPAHWLTYTDAGPELRARVAQQPQAWFLLLDPNPLRNQLHYFTGQAATPPRVQGLAGQEGVAHFRRWLQRRLLLGEVVYTDALSGPRLLDRAHLTLGNSAARRLRGFATRRVAELPTSFGPVYLVEIKLPPGADAWWAAPKSSASAPTTTGAAR